MKARVIGLAGAAALALMTAAAGAVETQVAQGPGIAKGAPPAPGLPVLDQTVGACQNFYQHACNAWIAANPIPEDQSRWGSFGQLSERNQEILRGILEKAAANPTPETRKIGDFYAACMDEAAIEKKGLAPLQPLLDRISGLSDKKDLAPLLAELHRTGVGALFRLGQQQSFTDATQAIAVADQSGLGLPDRDFYFKDDEKSKQQRDAYVAHVARMFELAGDSADTAKAKADAVLAVETKLAEGSMDRVKRRDPLNRNNPRSWTEFTAVAPAIDWATYRQQIGTPAFDSLNVNNPAFFETVQAVVTGTELDDLKTYLSWHLLRAASPWLPDAFVQENFDFYGRTLSGAKELRARWKRCVSAVDSALGEDLGKHFVEVAFGPEHKERMLRMVGDVQDAFYEEIPKLDWMGPETQKKAREKLRAMANKIGYPDEWKDYSKLEVRRDDALGNAGRAFDHEYQEDLAKIGTRVDRGEWFMSPPTVNAYYSPSFNDINFPAGILQPPFFDMTADDAYNYGAIGGVIGHEITHGFDDSGRKYDAKGNLENWWTDQDAERFTERAQCLVDQYSEYVADGDVKLNGKATLGENTADNGGTRIALEGLKRRLGAKGMAEKIGGLDATQRFFYGWAHVWCADARPEARRLQALTGVHSLPEYRVNGTISNSPEFARAFNCKPGDPMVRETQCKVW